jgi:hypothetical protein
MTDDPRVSRRAAETLPEEQVGGGPDDPEAQAEAILEESDIRSTIPVPAERRTSDEATPPA